jgi:hypothetical protein
VLPFPCVGPGLRILCRMDGSGAHELSANASFATEGQTLGRKSEEAYLCMFRIGPAKEAYGKIHLI